MVAELANISSPIECQDDEICESFISVDFLFSFFSTIDVARGLGIAISRLCYSSKHVVFFCYQYFTSYLY